MLLALFVTYVAFVFETSLSPLLGWGGLTPRPVLAALVCIVWRANGRNGLLLAAAWGLIADGLSTGPLGVDVVVFVIAAAIIQASRDNLPGWPLMIGLISGLTAFVVPAAGTCVRMTVERQAIEWDRIGGAAAGPACTTAVLATLLIIMVRSLFGRPAAVDRDTVANVSNRWKMLTE